jgi:hypothetical protein
MTVAVVALAIALAGSTLTVGLLVRSVVRYARDSSGIMRDRDLADAARLKAEAQRDAHADSITALRGSIDDRDAEIERLQSVIRAHPELAADYLRSVLQASVKPGAGGGSGLPAVRAATFSPDFGPAAGGDRVPADDAEG